MHGDDILLSGPRTLADAVRKSPRKRYETREQTVGAGPDGASEIIMLNRRVQWKEKGIRISPDPRHVKEIIEELCLDGATPGDTPMIMNQSSNDRQRLPCPEHARCHTVPEARCQIELLGNGSARHSLRCINHEESRLKPERCGYGQTQESGSIFDWATDSLGRNIDGEVRSDRHHGVHRP